MIKIKRTNLILTGGGLIACAAVLHYLHVHVPNELASACIGLMFPKRIPIIAG